MKLPNKMTIRRMYNDYYAITYGICNYMKFHTEAVYIINRSYSFNKALYADDA